MIPSLSRAALPALMGSGLVHAAFSIDTPDAIKQTARTLAYDLLTYYKGNQSGQTPGILPGPPPQGDYYWWEGGAMWGTLIDYWHLTGDTTYNDLVTEAMLFQAAPTKDYMEPNVTASLGNDDQAFWGMSAMLAAEVNFPNPPKDQPQWLALAQAVFNTQADPSRHDKTCNGGLRWQIPFLNNGYNYKNSIANGCFFNLGARLARYTKNDTYSKWADDTWDWMRSVGFMDDKYAIYDGAHVETNCTDINRAQFSYNNGVYLQGAAFMWNHTQDAKWKQRVSDLLAATFTTFFPNDIAYEIACEDHMTCTTDMLSFKGYVHRWLSVVAQLCPFVHDDIIRVLKTSTAAGVAQCNGGSNGRTCGFHWATKTFDGSIGAGQTMNVLGAVSSLLIDSVDGPYTNETGGTSIGDYNAGSSGDNFMNRFGPITTADKAGAAILTLLILAGATGTFGWMSLGT